MRTMRDLSKDRTRDQSEAVAAANVFFFSKPKIPLGIEPRFQASEAYVIPTQYGIGVVDGREKFCH